MSEPRGIELESDVAELLTAAPPRRVSARLAAAAKREARSKFEIACLLIATCVSGGISVGVKDLKGYLFTAGMATATLVAAIYGLRSRRRALALLREGRLAEADIISLEATGRERDYKPVYVVNLRLRGTDLWPVAITRHQPDIVRFLEERHGLNRPVYVLYDPSWPTKLLLPEIL